MLRSLLARFRSDEGGTVATEFVVMFPVVIAMFFASFESGYMVLRAAMLERSLDMTVRDLRLGVLRNPSVEFLRQRLCSRTDVFEDCEQSVTIELTRINSSFSNLPTVTSPCVRRSLTIQAGTTSPTVDTGLENEMLVIRACLVVDAMFPTAFMGVSSALADADGTYQLVAVSAFVNEPN
jgi:hypothetical protein